MKKMLLFGLIAVMAVIAAACGGGGDHGSMDMGASSDTANGAVVEDGFNDADVTFAQVMIVHHAQAIEMADLAAERNHGPEVADLATGIKRAQQPEIEQLSGWLTAWGQSVPDPASSMSHDDHSSGEGMMSNQEMASLEAATGPAFDKMFLEMMIRHHEGAIAMANQEINDGEFGPAEALARNIVTAQEGEIAEMNQLLAAMS